MKFSLPLRFSLNREREKTTMHRTERERESATLTEIGKP